MIMDINASKNLFFSKCLLKLNIQTRGVVWLWCGLQYILCLDIRYFRDIVALSVQCREVSYGEDEGGIFDEAGNINDESWKEM